MTIPHLTIVVADDKQEIVDAVARDLGLLADKYHIDVVMLKAVTGAEVIEFADTRNVDAFFIDYMFDYGMNGDEIMNNIRDPFQTKFYVLMSGWKEDVLEKIIAKNHSRLKNRCKFLRKPYDRLTFQACFLDILSFFEMRPYPLPIEYVYERVQNSSDGFAKAHALKDFYETLLKFSVSVLMADLSKQESFAGYRAKFRLDLQLTFGAWLSWLISLLDFYECKSVPSFMPELLAFLRMSEAKPLDTIGKFKEIRDSELGHGYVTEQEWYEHISADCQRSFNPIYKGLQFLSSYPLIVPQKTEIFPETDEYKYQVRSLMGSDMIAGQVNFISTIKLRQNSVYLYSPADKVLSLSPFMLYKACSSCHTSRLYFLDRIQNRALSYNSFCNHRIEDVEAKRQFDSGYRFAFASGN